jgi:RNA polymerase sigma factor (sigma-70 family)
LDVLRRFVKHDYEANKLIYKENYPIIHALVVGNNGSADDAKDIFQEALIVLFEKASAANFELTSKISTYLYSVARRLWLKKLQQKSGSYKIGEYIEETVAVEDDIEAHQEHNFQMDMMHDALTKIGEPCKSLLEAYYFQKLHMNDIAQQFGYTNADNAKNQKYKCLVRLKKLFFAQLKNG